MKNKIIIYITIYAGIFSYSQTCTGSLSLITKPLLTQATQNFLPAAYSGLKNHSFSPIGTHNQKQLFTLSKTNFIDPMYLPVIASQEKSSYIGSLFKTFYSGVKKLKKIAAKSIIAPAKKEIIAIDFIEDAWQNYQTTIEKNKNQIHQIVTSLKKAFNKNNGEKIKELIGQGKKTPGLVTLVEPLSNIKKSFDDVPTYVKKAKEWYTMLYQLKPSLLQKVKQKLSNIPLQPTGGISVSGPQSIFNWILPNFSFNIGGMYNPQKRKAITLISDKQTIAQYLGSLGHSRKNILGFTSFIDHIKDELLKKNKFYNEKSLHNILKYFCLKNNSN